MAMNYREFREELLNQLRSIFGENYEIGTQTVQKVNLGNVETFRIFDKTGEKQQSPVFYGRKLYEEYKRGTGLEVLAQDMKEKYEMTGNEITVDLIGDVNVLEEIKERLIFTVINREKNRELLKEIPHRDFLDFAVIYRIVVKESWDGVSSMRVSNGLFERWGITEEKLFEIARKNMRRRMPVMKTSLADMMQSLMGKDMISPGDVSEECEERQLQRMYMVTNRKKINGFGSVLYPDVLEKMCQILQCDRLYILPSSVHEAIVMPQDLGMSPEELQEMVKNVNKDCVTEEEYLSDSVYGYSLETQEIYITSDSGKEEDDYV